VDFLALAWQGALPSKQVLVKSNRVSVTGSGIHLKRVSSMALMNLREKTGRTIETESGETCKVNIDKFAKSATVLKPAPSSQLVPRKSHAQDNTSQGSGTLPCIHPD
jgi:hypothetical protein